MFHLQRLTTAYTGKVQSSKKDVFDSLNLTLLPDQSRPNHGTTTTSDTLVSSTRVTGKAVHY